MRKIPFLTWTCILTKHVIKSPAVFLLLLLIPTVTAAARFLPKDDGALKAGLYFENDDNISLKLKEDLLKADGSFAFIIYEDEETLKGDVLNGTLECGYLFKYNMSDRVEDGKYKRLIDLVISEQTLFSSGINEIVFASLLKHCGANFLDSYVSSDYFDRKDFGAARKMMIEKYSYYCESGETFRLDIETVDGEALNGKDDGMGIDFPLRGMLAILIFLSGLIGAAQWMADCEKGIFAPRPVEFKALSRILYPLIPVLLFLACSQLSLILSGHARPFAAEIACSIKYAVIIVVFSNLCTLIFRKSKWLISAIPAVCAGCLVFCPIFFDIGNFIPALSFLSKIFPPTYFL